MKNRKTAGAVQVSPPMGGGDLPTGQAGLEVAKPIFLLNDVKQLLTELQMLNFE
ncbi:MAG: hypothetical protein ACHQIM_06475 [Sphingobacteriales bacterium]